MVLGWKDLEGIYTIVAWQHHLRCRLITQYVPGLPYGAFCDLYPWVSKNLQADNDREQALQHLTLMVHLRTNVLNHVANSDA